MPGGTIPVESFIVSSVLEGGNRVLAPKERSDSGAFERQEDAFTDWVTPDGSSGFPAESGRYHLYVSLACPWAHRIVIVRRLKGLQKVIGMTVVGSDQGRSWMGFSGRARLFGRSRQRVRVPE